MANALDVIWQAYQVSVDSQAVVRAVVKRSPEDGDACLAETCFAARPEGECLALLERSWKELDDPAVVGLFAAFEQVLRQYCEARLENLGRSLVGSADFESAVNEWFRSQYMPRDVAQVLRLFSPPAPKALCDETNRIRDYRNWIGHGRAGNPKQPIAPEQAYRVLTEFLVSAGCVQGE